MLLLLPRHFGSLCPGTSKQKELARWNWPTSSVGDLSWALKTFGVTSYINFSQWDVSEFYLIVILTYTWLITSKVKHLFILYIGHSCFRFCKLLLSIFLLDYIFLVDLLEFLYIQNTNSFVNFMFADIILYLMCLLPSFDAYCHASISNFNCG